jgi:hypothetical protein
MTDSYGYLLDTAIRRFDAVCARHARRVPPGDADVRILASRRRLLVDRAFAQDWIVPDERVVQVDSAIENLESATDREEAVMLDRFAFLVLAALERRRPERLARDAMDTPLIVEAL